MDSFDEIWSRIMSYCKANVSESIYKIWFETIESAEYINNTITVTVQSDFQKEILENNFKDIFENAVEANLGLMLPISFITSEKYKIIEEEEKKEDGKFDTSDGFDISNYKFDNFVVGNSNRFAYNAALNVAETKPGETSRFNPLFIYGKSGLGKTHLMYAMINKMREERPELKIAYTTTENFMNQFIGSVRNSNMESFRKKYRYVDALFIDDIQFIKTGEQTQIEFFHTFNELISKNKQIVITSDRSPKEIESLTDRIRTRLENGLLIDIKPPEIETRKIIIEQKAEEYEVKLKKEHVRLLAEKIIDNVRQIEGAVKKIGAYESMNPDRDITTTQVLEYIKEVENEDKPVAATIEDIISSVSDSFNISIEDIKSDKRNSNISVARNVCMYVIRNVLSLTYSAIGQEFGKTHSTVMHSIENIEEEMKKDVNFKMSVTNIIDEFNNK